jgi:hypothetical protein
MFLGFVRDRGAMIFTILIPVLFLVLLGSIYKSSSTPHLTVVEVGKVSLLDQAAAAGHRAAARHRRGADDHLGPGVPLGSDLAGSMRSAGRLG